jgi:hypothetical protein
MAKVSLRKSLAPWGGPIRDSGRGSVGKAPWLGNWREQVYLSGLDIPSSSR